MVMAKVSMKNKIQKRLRELEETRGIKTLWAVESGSRSSGLASNDSDYDIRFIFHYPVNEYLRLRKPKRVLTFQEEPLDFQGFDIYKALELLAKSNPSLIEWLRSPLRYVDTDSPLIREMRKIGVGHFNPVAMCHHYRGMGWGNFRRYILRERNVTYKRYLYAFRGVFYAQYINRLNVLPTLNFMEDLILKGHWVPASIMTIVLQLMEHKKAGEDKVIIDRIPELDDYLTRLFDVVEVCTPAKARRVIMPDNIDDLIVECLTQKE